MCDFCNSWNRHTPHGLNTGQRHHVGIERSDRHRASYDSTCYRSSIWFRSLKLYWPPIYEHIFHSQHTQHTLYSWWINPMIQSRLIYWNSWLTILFYDFLTQNLGEFLVAESKFCSWWQVSALDKLFRIIALINIIWFQIIFLNLLQEIVFYPG